jgi:hypothetical protein
MQRPEGLDERFNERLRDVLLAQLAGRSNDCAHLLEVVHARSAERQVPLHDQALLSGQRALQVVGGELHEVAAG